MTGKRLLIEPEAQADVDEAYQWYEAQRAGLGDDYLLCVEAALNAIAERPGAFPVVLKRTQRALVRRFPYLILFIELADVIAVVGVFHTSRDPKRWRKRAK